MIGASANGRGDGGGVSESAIKLRDQTTALAQTVAGEAAGLAATGAGRARDVGLVLAERARQRLPELKERAGEQSSSVAQAAQALGGQVSDVAQVGADRARDVGQKVTNEVVPTLRELAMQAASIALERWEAARARALEAPAQAERAAGLVADRSGPARESSQEVLDRARRSVDELLDQARRSADEILVRARGAADAAAGAAGGTVERAGAAAGAAAEPVVERAKSARQQAGREVKEVSHRAAETGNDTLGVLFWGAAAAGIVWYALLNRERREQLERFAKSAWTEGSEIWRDLKGTDEAF
jgi:hypothetical protein